MQPGRELRRQLLGRAHVSAAADWLEAVEAEGAPSFTRANIDNGGDLTALLRACLLMLQLSEPVVAAYRLPPPPPLLWPIADAIARERQRLEALPVAVR